MSIACVAAIYTVGRSPSDRHDLSGQGTGVPWGARRAAQGSINPVRSARPFRTRLSHRRENPLVSFRPGWGKPRRPTKFSVEHSKSPDFSAHLLIDVDLGRIERGMSLRRARVSLAGTSPGRYGSTARSSGKNADTKSFWIRPRGTRCKSSSAFPGVPPDEGPRWAVSACLP